jgi:hypothetical protein
VPWVTLWVGLAFAGVVVLGFCAIKVFLAVQGLGRELERTRARLAPKQAKVARELKGLDRPRE